MTPTLTPSMFGPGTRRGNFLLFCHLLRAYFGAVRKSIGQRWAHLGDELAGAINPLAAQASSVPELVSRMVARWGQHPFTERGAPLSVWIPTDVAQLWPFTLARSKVDLVGEDGEPAGTEDLASTAIPWAELAARLDLEAIRATLAIAPDFLGSFVTQFVATEERRVFAEDYDLFAWVSEAPPKFAPIEIKGFTAPLRWHALIRLLSPLAHGGDQTGSNIAALRREQKIDPLTGTVVSIPFVSGAAVRGSWRDLVMLDWLALLGLTSQQIRPQAAHALLAGGSIDAGSSVGINNTLRAQIRKVCPAWDLFAGCVDGQLMQGQLLVGDATLVCRESLAFVAPALGLPLDDETLLRERENYPTADAQVVTRHGTRRHHDEVEGDSTQMIMHTQAIMSGAVLAHHVALRVGPHASALQLSTLAHAVKLAGMTGQLGAKGQAGFGRVEWGLYHGLVPFASSNTAYLEAVEKNRAEAIAWLVDGPAKPPKPEAAPKEKGAGAKGKAGKEKKDAAPVAT